MNKTLILGGLILIFMGICTFYTQGYYSYTYDRFIDFDSYNKPYGIALAVAGALFIWKSLTKKYKPDLTIILICPKCDEAFQLKESSAKRCPNCDTDLEPLKGYYERHPERKEGAKSKQRKQSG